MLEQPLPVDFIPIASFPDRKKLLRKKVYLFPGLLRLKRFQTLLASS